MPSSSSSLPVLSALFSPKPSPKIDFCYPKSDSPGLPPNNDVPAGFSPNNDDPAGAFPKSEFGAPLLPKRFPEVFPKSDPAGLLSSGFEPKSPPLVAPPPNKLPEGLVSPPKRLPPSGFLSPPKRLPKTGFD